MEAERLAPGLRLCYRYGERLREQETAPSVAAASDDRRHR
jgi:hypothetical protein